MLKRFATIATLALTCATSALAPASAQDGPLALRGLEGQIASLEAAATPNGFELGALQVLRAVEVSLQTRYEYGLGDSALNLPLLRLNARGRLNPLAKPASHDTLSNMIGAFMADIGKARETLAAARASGVQPFELNINDLWFDVNMNAQRDKGESAMEVLGQPLMGRRWLRGMKDAEPGAFTVRFDEADHAWLVAYTHLLTGFGNLYMAFDPTPVFARLAEQREMLKQAPRLPEYYDLTEVTRQVAELRARRDTIKARLKELKTLKTPFDKQIRALRREMNKPENKPRRDELKDKIDAISAQVKPLREQERAAFREQGQVRAELRSAEAKLPTGRSGQRDTIAEMRPSIDAIYVLITALKQQPDAARIQAAMADWRMVIAENRRFWTLVEAETDNDREWIPNPRQEAVLPVAMDPALGTAWREVLKDAEALLNGKLLIPHPLLPAGYGVSLAHYERYPTPLDLTELLHGVGIYEHAAKGPRISSQAWQSFNRLSQGRGGLFALFLN